MEFEKRMRYTVDDDVCLLKEILCVNPFEDGERWKEIQLNLYKTVGKSFSVRSIKDHFKLMMKMYIKVDEGKRRKVASGERYEEKEKLLQSIKKLAEDVELNSGKSQKTIKPLCKIEGVATGGAALSYYASDYSLAHDSIVENEDESSDSDGEQLNSEMTPVEACSIEDLLGIKGVKRKNGKRNTLDLLERKICQGKEYEKKEQELEERRLKLAENRLELEKEQLELKKKEQEFNFKLQSQRLQLEAEERREAIRLTALKHQEISNLRKSNETLMQKIVDQLMK